MACLLTASTNFVVVGFALVMLIDFVAGLNHLWEDSQPKEVDPSQMRKPQTRMEDVVNGPASQAEAKLKPLQTKGMDMMSIPTTQESGYFAMWRKTPQDTTLSPDFKSEETEGEVLRIDPENSTQPELAAMPNTQLRKLCGEKGIRWRDVYGKNKHLSKPEMIAVLVKTSSRLHTKCGVSTIK